VEFFWKGERAMSEMDDERDQKPVIIPAQPGYEFLSCEFWRSDQEPSLSRTAIVAWEIRFDGEWPSPDVYPVMLSNTQFGSMRDGIDDLENIVCGILRPDGKVEELNNDNPAFGTLLLHENEDEFMKYIERFFASRRAEEECYFVRKPMSS